MKKNAQTSVDELIGKFPDKRPRLLLHSCCAPCSSYVLEYLSGQFDITVFFFNPNIYPQTEHEKRALEQSRLIQEMPFSSPVQLIIAAYQPERFQVPPELMSEPEGGSRCNACFSLRLSETARLAKKEGFDAFTTTLTVSPHKNAGRIHEIGNGFADAYGLPFLSEDFKKKNGYKRSVELSKQYNLYRQRYCGCEFSTTP